MECCGSYHHSHYRCWCSVFSLEYFPIGMDCRTSLLAFLCNCHLCFFIPPFRLLQNSGSCNCEKKLLLHGCCQSLSWQFLVLVQALQSQIQDMVAVKCYRILCQLIMFSVSLGNKRTWLAGSLQYLSLYGVSTAYVITTATCLRYNSR